MRDIMKASRNIFEDLAVVEPDMMLAKAELARKIQKIDPNSSCPHLKAKATRCF